MLAMAQLELDRLVRSGRPRDGEHTYALHQDRVGSRPELESFEHAGRAFCHASGEPPDGPGQPDGHLPQLLDEIYRAYLVPDMQVPGPNIGPGTRDNGSY